MASASAGIFGGSFFGSGLTIAGTFFDIPGFGSLDPESEFPLSAVGWAEPASPLREFASAELASLELAVLPSPDLSADPSAEFASPGFLKMVLHTISTIRNVCFSDLVGVEADSGGIGGGPPSPAAAWSVSMLVSSSDSSPVTASSSVDRACMLSLTGGPSPMTGGPSLKLY